MDLLGSILGNMEKPPVIKKSTEEQERLKKEQDKLKKIQDVEKQKLKEFREDVRAKIDKFVANETGKSIEFKPMEKILRGIVHDIAESADLQGISFGIEGEDRHVVVYKKEHLPSIDEIACLKRGELYDPVKIELERKAKEEEEANYKAKKEEDKPNSNYHDKYKHIIGDEIESCGVSAAQIAKPNQQFGYVPSSHKQDKRSIEETLQDMKKKKLKNLEQTTE